MNKADNVPIATLSGISCLTEIAPELPLPSSTLSSQSLQLLGNPQNVQKPVETMAVVKLLQGVNTAYLDFKNSSYNCPTSFTDQTKLPMALQQTLQINPMIFQPQFDSYHGSPLKANSMTALAYSPSQRNAFIQQQAMLQQQQKLQMQGFSKGNHVQNLFKDEPNTSKQGFQDFQQHQVHQQHLYKQQEQLQQLTIQQHQREQQAQQRDQEQLLLQQREELHHQQQQEQQQMNEARHQQLQYQQQQLQYQQQQHQQKIPPERLEPVQKQLAHVQEQLAHVQEQLACVQSPTVSVASGRHDPGKSRKKSTSSISKSMPIVNVEKIDVYKEQLMKGQMAQEEPFFSPLKTRGQRAGLYLIKSSEMLPVVTKESSQLSGTSTLELRVPKLVVRKVKRVEGSSEVETLEVYSPEKDQQTYNVSNREIFKKENVDHKKSPQNTKQMKKDTEQIQKKKDIQRNNLLQQGEGIKQGQNIIIKEDKNKSVQGKEIVTEQDFTQFTQETVTGLVIPHAKTPTSTTRTHKRTPSHSSRNSSASSIESVKVKKRKKKKVSSSSDEEPEKTGIEQEVKRFKPSDIDDIEGVEIKLEVKKFMFTLNKILERELELEADGQLDINEDIEIPSETLLPRSLISTFAAEIMKMKSSHSLSEIPVDQLVRVMSVMDRHVRETIQVSLQQDDEDEETRHWVSMQSERILRSAEAATIILNITTAPDMPKQVYLEEAIEHVAMFCQHQLDNIIYPEFDHIYKLPDAKDTFSYKGKRNNRIYSGGSGSRNKSILKIYNRICEVVSLLGDLVGIESLTDSIILKISQIGISPFFVENVNVLQLEALKVSRTVFRNYVKHRDLILDDILSSLARLPSNKRNLRNYRLQDSTENIQMFSALVLQLVQCTVQIPQMLETDKDDKTDVIVDKDVLIVKSYEDALRAAQNFMSVFLKKCSSKDENDFRPLFENFLYDLFLCANLPEWPAAEVLLTQLGRLFVVTFSNTKNDMLLRSTALDYLAKIATHLRKVNLRSQKEKEKLMVIVERLINMTDDDDVPVVEDMDVYDEKLRKSLLQYLLLCIQKDSSFKYAREFYLGQWIRDIQIEIEKSMIAPMLSIPGAAIANIETDGSENKEEEKVSAEKLQILQEKKEFYHSLIREKTVSTLRSDKQLSYEKACVVVNHLASTRPFSQSFDLYMQQIFKMLSEQAIGLRTKAVKALTLIVSVDENILSREDVQASVHGRLLDPSTNVREAAVDLIGQFILKCPELIKQYYNMIIARILDTGVSVRKRVIKLLKDICVLHPEFEKVPEICSKIIRRVDDEIGIKKLVTEVFRVMWFQPDSEKQSNEVYTKAVNITKVVALCKDTGYDWLESLLENLFDPDNPSSRSITIKACQQIVDCLVIRMLKPEQRIESNVINSCLLTLHLFCKSYPKLLVPHATLLQPFLSSKISNQNDLMITQNVTKILELIVPLMDHPNPKFLAELEEDTMKLMLKQSQNVVQSSASCLAAIVNNCTHNYKFVVDAFNQFHRFLKNYKSDHTKNPTHPLLAKKRPTLLRALFTIGLLCRYFDLDRHVPECARQQQSPAAKSKTVDTITETTSLVFDLVLYFTDFNDEEISTKALLCLGFIGVRHPKLLLIERCRKLYQEILSPTYASIKSKFIILKNLQNHLMEDEKRLAEDSKKKSPVKRSNRRPNKNEFDDDKSDIKEIGDALSGTTSEIVQVLLKDIMKSFLHAEKQVRISALQVVAIILRQGLIHPAQCIPYLIAISTDPEKLCHVKSEQCLNDLDSRYQGFVHMKAFQGVKMSYELQKTIQKNEGKYLCGYRETDNKIALLNHVYGMIRSNKQYRRPFILSILKQFDEKKAPDFLYYLVENLVYMTYNTQEEPLFIIHHVDTLASVSGANSLQTFKELLNESEQDYEDEDKVSLTREDHRVDTTKLLSVVKESFGCLLLLEVKAFLKTLYGFTDNKCQKYSPSEPSKLYDKAITRKSNQDFISQYKDFIFSANHTKDELLQYYFEFKQLMLSLDTEEDSDAEDVKSEVKVECADNSYPNEELQGKEEDIKPEVNMPKPEVSISTEDELKTTDISDQPGPSGTATKTSTGVIPQSLENTLLPGLKININIPVIPINMLEQKYKPKKPRSRRSSRSSRGSIA